MLFFLQEGQFVSVFLLDLRLPAAYVNPRSELCQALGAGGGSRTHDPLFTKQPLWPLSYAGPAIID